MLAGECSRALNQRETVASGQTREKSRIEFRPSIAATLLEEISDA
jgi:hypothetical protein